MKAGGRQQQEELIARGRENPNGGPRGEEAQRGGGRMDKEK